MTILLRAETVRSKTIDSAMGMPLPVAADIDVAPPGEESQAPALLSASAGATLPGWRLSLSLVDPQQIDATATKSNRLYLWTGVLVVLFTSVFAVFIARAFQRQLRLANLKNDLVGNVSHELKTPLTSMRLLVDTLLEDDQFDEQTTRDYLRLIAKENSRLSRLIENFLTFTRMEQQQNPFDLQPLAPLDIVNNALDSAGERFHSSDCSLSVQVDEELPLVGGDKDSLVTVLLNLLDNAYKYSDPPREITLRANRSDQGVAFSVSDNGIGLPRTASRRIFQRFFQVDQSLTRDRSGCGLGLSIVESIVKAHRGTVSVTSSAGKGSTFTVALPVASGTSTHPRDVPQS
jgi:signal transduction histidine kinase